MAGDKQTPQPLSDDDLLADAIPIDAADDGAELEPIELDDASDPRSTREIKAFAKAVRHGENWSRKPTITGQGATHVRTFVTKLRLDAIEHIDEQINEWLDQNPEYEVKFVTTAIGTLVSKTTEEALFLSVWV